MKQVGAFLIILVTLWSQSVHPVSGLLTIAGGSMRNVQTDSETLASISSNIARVYLEWSYCQRTLGNGSLPLTSTVSELQATADEWLPSYSQSLNWAVLDGNVGIVRSQGLQVIAETGDGSLNAVPIYNGPALANASDGWSYPEPPFPIDPNTVGTEQYLALQYRWTRTVVNRFKNVTALWQTENELNEAFLESLAGIRYDPLFPSIDFANTPAANRPRLNFVTALLRARSLRSPAPAIAFNLTAALANNQWGNWTFVTALLQTLRQAVIDEDPNGLTTTNLHTDVPLSIHQEFGLPGYYLTAMHDWKDLVDVSSFDAYPNYFVGTPLLGSLLGQRITSLAQVTNPSTPIMVMETGFPTATISSSNTAVMPTAINFTNANQGLFYQQAVQAVVASGGQGFLFFGSWESPGIYQNYTAQDIHALQLANQAFQTGDLSQIIAYSALHPVYMATQFPAVSNRVQNAWGILGPQGQKGAGYFDLSAAYLSSLLPSQKNNKLFKN